MTGPMTAYRCDITSVVAAQMACQPANFCLLLLSAPYFTYFDTDRERLSGTSIPKKSLTSLYT